MYKIATWHPHDSVISKLESANYKVGELLEVWEIGEFIVDMRNVGLNIMIIGDTIFVDSRRFGQR